MLAKPVASEGFLPHPVLRIQAEVPDSRSGKAQRPAPHSQEPSLHHASRGGGEDPGIEPGAPRLGMRSPQRLAQAGRNLGQFSHGSVEKLQEDLDEPRGHIRGYRNMERRLIDTVNQYLESVPAEA